MMDIKQILLSDASTDAKLSALAILIDKQFPKLENKVLEVEKLQGPVGDKGDKGDQGPQGERGKDGKDGKNGSNGKDGVDGKDGENGVSIDGVKIDFDGSLVVTLTDGRVINVGEIVPIDVAEKIRTVHNIQIGSGGDSQTVLDAIAALQATIATYGTMATQNANNVAITGGTINNTTVGATTPSTGVFTTLTATGQTSLGGAAGSEGLRVLNVASTVNYIQARGHITANAPSIRAAGSDTNIGLGLSSQGTGAISFYSSSISSEQMRVSHTPSAVNYVQVTGAATGGFAVISTQGSDASVGLNVISKGALGTTFATNGSSSNIQFRVLHAASAVNRIDAVGSATGISPVVSVSGTDTNISQVFQSKGTGAIDLAAGSRGVNISNGGTVTAITTTANGNSYTSLPSIAISSPTTAGGVQATSSVSAMFTSTGTIVNGGTGYTVNDVITLVGGTVSGGGVVGRYTVTAVSGGVITAVTRTQGNYVVLPTNPVSVTGGTGTGATLNVIYTFQSASITNAGSGYVEQPTVTFSGGGGSGAAAYATVGAGTVVKSIGSSIDIATPTFITSSIPVARFRDIGGADTFTQFQPNSGYAQVIAQGNSNGNLFLAANGTGRVSVQTNGTSQTEQLRVAHTASAVNYVQVTGAATGNQPQITAQGSDANVILNIASKGNASILFNANSAEQFRTGAVASAVNSLQLNGATTGNSPSLQARGTNTDIDVVFTPKGTGNVRFGTYTGTALSIAGYIEIKDSGGTVRKLAVVA
jgi:hypothetical protein